MANRGWGATIDGGGVASNARTTGRVVSDGGDEFIQGSKIADPGEHNDPLDKRSDLFGNPGQLTAC